MLKEEVIERILKILENKIPEGKTFLSRKEAVTEPLEVGSLIFLELLTEVEKEFSIHIEDDYWEYDKLSSIQAIADYIETALEKRELV